MKLPRTPVRAQRDPRPSNTSLPPGRRTPCDSRRRCPRTYPRRQGTRRDSHPAWRRRASRTPLAANVSRNRIQIAAVPPSPTPAPSPSPTPPPSPPVCGGDITIVQENANTGAGSHNVNDARVTQTCTIVRRQSVSVETDVRVDVRTGGNTATGNTGNGHTSSGDADVSVSVSVTSPLPGP